MLGELVRIWFSPNLPFDDLLATLTTSADAASGWRRCCDLLDRAAPAPIWDQLRSLGAAADVAACSEWLAAQLADATDFFTEVAQGAPRGVALWLNPEALADGEGWCLEIGATRRIILPRRRGHLLATAIFAGLFGVVMGCSGTSAPDGGGQSSLSDTGATSDVVADAAATDAAATDTADAAATDTAAMDAAAMDAAATSDGAGKLTAWGTITGACGAVTAELTSSGPSFLVTTLTFKDAAQFSPTGLSTGAMKRYEGQNAGGSSICSEVMSMQVLHECEGAALYKTETEIRYRGAKGAITDYETMMAGHKIGVSVTRAYKGPVIQTYTAADAAALLKKKLTGVLESSAKVRAADKWSKQVLHIWTLRADWVPLLKAAWDATDAVTRADTIVLVSVEVPPAGGKGWIVPDNCGVK